MIGDLRELEKLYMMSGRSKDMTAVYNDVLASSQDPRVRDYVYQQLARLQVAAHQCGPGHRHHAQEPG